MKEFKKTQIYFDNERFERSVKNANDNADKLTARYNEVAEFLERDLSGEDIMQLNNNGIGYIDSLLQPQFQFTNASKDFNLEAMGIKDEYYALLPHVNGLNTLYNANRYDWINKYSGQLVHKLRSEEAAILVGTNTALKDNPSLNVRKWTGNNPIRIIIDKDLKISKEYSVFDGKQKTIVICGTKPTDSENENLIFEKLDFSENIAGEICEVLYQHEIQSVIIEGGSHTLQQFIDANFWDEARIFTGKSHFRKGINAPEFSGNLVSEKTISGDHLKIYRND